MSLASLLRMLEEHWLIGASLIALLALFRLLVEPSFHLWLGKSRVVRLALRHLDPAVYRVYHDLHLPLPRNRGSVRIDHVIVSPFGIFVIESISLRGWIYGAPKQALWTHLTHRFHRHFDNPLPQHQHHISTLIDFLEIPDDLLHSALLFIGWPEFKTPMPANVLNRGLVRWIHSHTTPRLGPHAIHWLTARLNDLPSSPGHHRVRPAAPPLIRRTG